MDENLQASEIRNMKNYALKIPISLCHEQLQDFMQSKSYCLFELIAMRKSFSTKTNKDLKNRFEKDSKGQFDII